MTWLRLDDGFPRHRKVRRLSHTAFRLHVSAMCWCAEQLTDGLILVTEIDDVSDLTAKELAKALPELTGRGLWDTRADGWVIHDYLDYNPSREKVLAEREAAAARQAAYRDKKRRNAVSNGVTNAVTNGVTHASVTPTPSRPVPTPKGLGREGPVNSPSETRESPVDNSRPALRVVCSNPDHHVRTAGGSCLGCAGDRKAAGQ